ncbi:hypothetical protein OG242_32560 (plasmid) [Streptomyces sp. NBC_00727]|uniref:hypothetical protein n=1 Tax=Streptomyces sp. NBC_00727 TaxID=2903675 RepID=UPI002F9152CB
MDTDRGRKQQPHDGGNDRPYLYIHSYPPPDLPDVGEDHGERPVPTASAGTSARESSR